MFAHSDAMSYDKYDQIFLAFFPQNYLVEYELNDSNTAYDFRLRVAKINASIPHSET